MQDAKDLQTILASSIKEVWIDCAKGLDIAVGESAILEVESVLPVEVDRQRVAERPRQTAPVSAAKEMARATKIVRQSKQAVQSRLGPR